MTALEFLLTRRQPRPDPTNRRDLEDKLTDDIYSWERRNAEREAT